MTTEMFQVSDLAGARRRQFLDEAKQSSASLRDTDGSVLIMLAAQHVAALQEASRATSMLFAAEAALSRGANSPVAFGGFAWLADFDADDQGEALAEIRDAIALTIASADPAPLREVLHGWATTATVMRDPIRAAVFRTTPDDRDFSQVSEPAPPVG